MLNQRESGVAKRHINMRLKCRYMGEKNTLSRLEVEHASGAEWKALDLDASTPGFDIFVYAMFHCQHTCFRINCAERGLLLDSAEGASGCLRTRTGTCSI